MASPTRLEISLISTSSQPTLGEANVNVVRGGPHALLVWLETQLGLLRDAPPHSSRVTEYARILDKISDACYSMSLSKDRWATATELLGRRDELRLAGWDESVDSALPHLVNDMARAAEGEVFAWPDQADRLREILIALDCGQVLPPHRCVLLEEAAYWPKLWQSVLERLQIEVAPAIVLSDRVDTALWQAQSNVLGEDEQPLDIDEKLRWITARSETAACEAIAAMLVKAPDDLPETVVYCENDMVAMRLDACLSRVGLPTMGAGTRSAFHPASQILPLALALCWEPVDPAVVLDFLSLPIGPMPRHACRILASALNQQPGLGSAAWERALGELCDETNDPDGKLRERVDQWLNSPRVDRGRSITLDLVRQRCSLVARWATSRAVAMEKDLETAPEPRVAQALAASLRSAANQATLLDDLVKSQGSDLAEPQLARLLEEVLETGIKTVPCVVAYGGPIRVRSLAEIRSPCRRLVWLGLGAAETPTRHWSVVERRQLRGAGIEMNAWNAHLTALRAAERRGFSQVQDQLLAVLLPSDHELRWHPIWLEIANALKANGHGDPVALEDLIAADDGIQLAPWDFATESFVLEPVQPPRPLWSLPATMLKDRDSTSATSLQDRLGCPLKWVFRFCAKLKPGSIARLPNDFLLKGNFAHSVLQNVFGSGRGSPLPSIDESLELIEREFAARLPLDAAPLALPNRVDEAMRFLAELKSAAQSLVKALHEGGYDIQEMEAPIEAMVFGKKLVGFIDCLAVTKEGREAIIDFKYPGPPKYQQMLEEGRAVQLGTYAHGRKMVTGAYPAVAYLRLGSGLLNTPKGSRLSGADEAVVAGPSIATVWEDFAEAIQRSDAWLVDSQPIPARPLQDVAAWPPGCELVLIDPASSKGKRMTDQEACRYCDYRQLCGREELS